jgi:hypothetical protein
MAKARQRANDDVEQALIEWGAFMRSEHDAKGFSAADRDLYGAVQSGAISDPVFASVLSMESAGNSLSHKVNMHLRRYGRDYARTWYAVPWARFVGRPVVTETRWVRVRDRIQIATGCFYEIGMRAEIPARWDWSGMLAWDDVGGAIGMSQRNAELIMSLVKRQLGMDLRADANTRRGKLLPDGAPSFAENRSMERARRQRAQARGAS